MEESEKNALTLKHDESSQAAGVRLRAARFYVDLGQLELGKAAGVTKSAISNCERGDSYPSRKLMRYFYRNHRIDYNYFIDGEWIDLPGSVQEKLFPLLKTAHSELDQEEH